MNTNKAYPKVNPHPQPQKNPTTDYHNFLIHSFLHWHTVDQPQDSVTLFNLLEIFLARTGQFPGVHPGGVEEDVLP